MKKSKSKKSDITLSGYYGFNSIGDDAVLYSILSGISKSIRDCRVNIIFKKNSPFPPLKKLNITRVSRKNPLHIIYSLLRSKVFISGGGSLLQDSTSKKSLFYYTSLICLAKLCGCKVFIFANGLGPLKSAVLPKLSLNISDLISLRDPKSYDLAAKYLKNTSKLLLSADPVFSYPFSESKKPFLACLSYLSKKPYFTVSLRTCKNRNGIDEDKLSRILLKLKAQGLTPVFVSMQDSYDLEISKRMAFLTGGIVSDVRNMDDLYALLKGAEFAIGMRLHFLLASIIAYIPTVALSYDSKIDGCLSYLGSNSILSAFDFSEEDLFRSLRDAKLFSFSPKLYENTEKMKSLSGKDLQLLQNLIMGKNVLGDVLSLKKSPADT